MTKMLFLHAGSFQHQYVRTFFASSISVYACSFDTSLCNWSLVSEGGLKFERLSGKDEHVGPTEDRLHYNDKPFLNMEAKNADDPENAMAGVYSGTHLAEFYKDRCFSFWYSSHVRT